MKRYQAVVIDSMRVGANIGEVRELKSIYSFKVGEEIFQSSTHDTLKVLNVLESEEK